MAEVVEAFGFGEGGSLVVGVGGLVGSGGGGCEADAEDVDAEGLDDAFDEACLISSAPEDEAAARGVGRSGGVVVVCCAERRGSEHVRQSTGAAVERAGWG